MLAAIAVLTACGPRQAPSSANSPLSPTPAQLSNYAVVVSGVQAGDTPTYNVAIVSTNGQTVASTTAANPNASSAPWQPLPKVSASASRVYYLDGTNSVKYLKPDGTTGLASHLPIQPDERGVFAVSPDDSRIAVSVFNLRSGMRLLVGRVAASPAWHQVLATTAVSEWPVGWRGNQLVLAVGYVSGGQQACAICSLSPISYHVVDADTGSRSATVCGAMSPPQLPGGPPSSSGVACATATKVSSSGLWTEESIAVAHWDGSSIPVLRTSCVPSAEPLALSPDGQTLAGERDVNDCGRVTTISLFDIHGHGRATAAMTTSYPWIFWIDAGHFCFETDDDRSSILDVAANHISGVGAAGLCLATIPGGLGG